MNTINNLDGCAIVFSLSYGTALCSSFCVFVNVRPVLVLIALVMFTILDEFSNANLRRFMDCNQDYDGNERIPIALSYSSTSPVNNRLAIEENEFIARNQFRLALTFSGLWLSYCWWLSERYHFDFGRYTTIARLIFCLLHVLTVWKFFQYMIKVAFRLHRFTRRIQDAVPRHLTIIVLSLVLFLLLTFVIHFKQFLRDAFAVVD
jgi:hypothetical protein